MQRQCFQIKFVKNFFLLFKVKAGEPSSLIFFFFFFQDHKTPEEVAVALPPSKRIQILDLFDTEREAREKTTVLLFFIDSY